MKGYFQFISTYTRQALFGSSLTFLSSFGQTFFVSLFVPFILRDLDISKGLFGGFYSVATVAASGFLLLYGHWVDSVKLRPLTLRALALLGIACITLSVSYHPIVLFIALVGLRLGGQGLMSHISMSVMARYFDKDRGKALSISSLGYPIGEMVFPALITLLISLAGWRIAAAVPALVLGVYGFMLPQMKPELMDLPPHNSVAKTRREKRRFYWNMVNKRRFWVVAFPGLVSGFVITGFFFYQYLLAERREWPLAIYATLFAGYGLIRFVFSLFGGSIIDRYSAARIFPWYTLPIGLAMLSLIWIDGLIGAVLFLIPVGISMGASGVVQTAVIAEVYGVEQIGRIRSVFSVMGVISTALSPLVFGVLLDKDVSFEYIAGGCGLLVLCAVAISRQIGRYTHT